MKVNSYHETHDKENNKRDASQEQGAPSNTFSMAKTIQQYIKDKSMIKAFNTVQLYFIVFYYIVMSTTTPFFFPLPSIKETGIP